MSIGRRCEAADGLERLSLVPTFILSTLTGVWMSLVTPFSTLVGVGVKTLNIALYILYRV